MGAVDIKKLDIAIAYLQRIADGKNPVNNLPVDEEDVLNDPNVIRCMFFVKEVLEEVKRNGGYIGKEPKVKKEKQEFPIETLQLFEYKQDLTISNFVKQINEQIDETIYKKLSYSTILRWLKQEGFLREYEVEAGKKVTTPTEKGIQIGIVSEKATAFSGAEYIRIIYTRQAQEYIVKNMQMILQ